MSSLVSSILLITVMKCPHPRPCGDSTVACFLCDLLGYVPQSCRLIPTGLQSKHAGTGTVIYRVLLQFQDCWQMTKQVCCRGRTEAGQGNRLMTLGQCVMTCALRASGLKYHWNPQGLSRYVRRDRR